MQTLRDSMTNLVGNMVVCSGAIAYQGPFTAAYRARLNESWVAKVKALNIKCADNPTVAKVLSDPVAVRHWGICGLPLDSLSVENAIFVTRSRRWSLMMDPQGQANRWIKNLQKENKLKVTKMSEAGMLRVLESSIRVGVPVLLENVLEKLDPALDPVLLKQTYKSQGRLMLRLGDTDVDYSEDFQFFVTTKLANPHYSPEVCIKVTLVNFTVTFEGLEDQVNPNPSPGPNPNPTPSPSPNPNPNPNPDPNPDPDPIPNPDPDPNPSPNPNQLLTDVAAIERPDLVEKKESLVLQISEGRKTIQELEDKILHLLATSTGNILDDEDLINTLDDSKVISTKTAEAVKGAEQTSAEIEVAQEAYRPVATRGSNPELNLRRAQTRTRTRP